MSRSARRDGGRRVGRCAGLVDSRPPVDARVRGTPAVERGDRRWRRRRAEAQDSKTSRRRSGRSVAPLGLMAFLPLASRAPLYARLMLALLADDRTPATRKALLAGAAGYLLVGRDIIPDDIPILGGLDDLVVVVLAVDLFLDGVPESCSHEKLDELGIDRVGVRPGHRPDPAVDAGPGPQDAPPRCPELVGQAACRASSSRASGPRLRNWINREEPIA